jgi:hypothetical protein
MRVSEEMLKSVCFMCSHNSERDSYSLVGTGFFVAWPGDGWPQIYLVTARHCVSQAQKRGDGRAHVLLNSKAGLPRHYAITQRWHYSQDTRIDLAAVCFDPGDDDDVRVIPKHHLLSPVHIEKHSIGIGDELWLAGLFWPVPGEGRMRPIIRVGNIAAMPEGPITVDDSEGRQIGPFAAYLAEVRSIGGLSGSPVWVHLPYGRLHDAINPPPAPAWRDSIVERIKRQQSIATGDNLSDYLLGVIRLHWTDSPGDDQHPITTDNEGGVVNMGIAGITPIDELASLLSRADVLQERKQRMADHVANLGRRAVEDSSSEDATQSPKAKRLRIDPI